MSKNEILFLYIAAFISIFSLFSCQLPFDYSSDDYSSNSGITDPSTPSITSPVVITYQDSNGNSGSLSDGESASTTADTTIDFTSETVGAVIYYTTDGATPDPRSDSTYKYSADSPLGLRIKDPTVDDCSASLTITATAIGSDMKPSLTTIVTVDLQYPQAEAPVFSLSGGVYDADQSLTLTSETEGAVIYYTKTEGNTVLRPEPGESGTYTYTGPIELDGPSNTWAVAAIAMADQLIDSTTSSASYSISYPSLATPTFNPPGDTYNNEQTITISSDSGSTIWYTLDGSSPIEDSSSRVESGGIITLPGSVETDNGVITVLALATQDGMNDSDETEAVYTFQAARPTPSESGGTHNNDLSIELTCSTSGAEIFYTTDGSDPTEYGTTYSNPISITSNYVEGTGTTIRSIALKDNYAVSQERSDTYLLKVAPPTFSPVGGTYNELINISMVTATSGATITYDYTSYLDSNSSGDVYSNPITTLNGDVLTLVAVATKSGYADSDTQSAEYLTAIIPEKPFVGISAQSGSSSTITLTLDCLGPDFSDYAYASLYISQNSNFSPYVIVGNFADDISGTLGSTSDYTTPPLSPETQYYFRVYVNYDYPNLQYSSDIADGLTVDSNGLPSIVTVTVPGSFTSPDGYYPHFRTSASGGSTSTPDMGLQYGGYILIPYEKEGNPGIGESDALKLR